MSKCSSSHSIHGIAYKFSGFKHTCKNDYDIFVYSLNLYSIALSLNLCSTIVNFYRLQRKDVDKSAFFFKHPIFFFKDDFLRCERQL